MLSLPLFFFFFLVGGEKTACGRGVYEDGEWEAGHTLGEPAPSPRRRGAGCTLCERSSPPALGANPSGPAPGRMRLPRGPWPWRPRLLRPRTPQVGEYGPGRGDGKFARGNFGGSHSRAATRVLCVLLALRLRARGDPGRWSPGLQTWVARSRVSVTSRDRGEERPGRRGGAGAAPRPSRGAGPRSCGPGGASPRPNRGQE